MGGRDFMAEQVRKKIAAGFRVLKMKVGALDFREELELLRWIRSEFFVTDLEIRLDANGAWTPGEAREKMKKLAGFGIHSVEQPIAAGQPKAMASLCRDTVIPVALDEELIGKVDPAERRRLLQLVAPSYIILKPGLLGGFFEAGDWIAAAGEAGIGWWVTSALESNIGLNAIAQWTWQLGVENPQGLGTGQLFRNNIVSPLQMKGDRLWYTGETGWDLGVIGI
jgi:O-succinylbenzoate synthase